MTSENTKISQSISESLRHALLLAGDDDYVDLIKAVKDVSGKRVYGAYFPDNASERLIKSFDQQIELTQDILKQFNKLK